MNSKKIVALCAIALVFSSGLLVSKTEVYAADSTGDMLSSPTLINREFTPETMPQGLKLAPASETDSSLSFIWDKPEEYGHIVGYEVYLNGELVTTTVKTHYTARSLTADTTYSISLKVVYSDGSISAETTVVSAKTKPASTVINIENYGAMGDNSTVNTTAIQAAIDACPSGGTVLVPTGTFRTGALDLKSNMTLRVDGVLQGTSDASHYEFPVPSYTDACDDLLWNRFEGWELYSYRSLINVGYINKDNRDEVTCENVAIIGSGSIRGGGSALATSQQNRFRDQHADLYNAMTSDERLRVRGRLFLFQQCKNVYLADLKIENPPCWTIQMTYCDTVTTHGIQVTTTGVRNGDGWNPDSSVNCMVYDSTFATGDDCIAIKSGKNPEGNEINKPTKNIRIFDITGTGGGLGLAVGSEMSGGVEDIYIRDVSLGDTRYGIELKANKVRGGYIRNFNVLDSEINRVLIHSVSYNGDGDPAPDMPIFEDITFKNVYIPGTWYNPNNTPAFQQLDTAVEIIGFSDSGHPDPNYEHYINNVVFDGVTFGSAEWPIKDIKLQYVNGVQFINTRQVNGRNPSLSYSAGNVFGLYIDPEPMAEFTAAIEAEVMSPAISYPYTKSTAASGNYYISTADTGTVSARYVGESGLVDFDLTYFDSDGGNAIYELYLNDELVETWVANRATGSTGADTQTLSVKTIRDVLIQNGDILTIKGIKNGTDTAMLDKVSVTVQEMPESGLCFREATLEQGRLASVNLVVLNDVAPTNIIAAIYDDNAGGEMIWMSQAGQVVEEPGDSPKLIVSFQGSPVIEKGQYYKIFAWRVDGQVPMCGSSVMPNYSNTDIATTNTDVVRKVTVEGESSIDIVRGLTVRQVLAALEPGADHVVLSYDFYPDEASAVSGMTPLDENALLTDGSCLTVTAHDGVTKAIYRVNAFEVLASQDGTLWGFDKGTVQEDGSIMDKGVYEKSVGMAKTFDPAITSSGELEISFKWKTNAANKTSFYLTDSNNNVIFIARRRTNSPSGVNFAYSGTFVTGSDPSGAMWLYGTGNSTLTATGDYYSVNLLVDFNNQTLSGTIRDAGGNTIQTLDNVSISATNLSKLFVYDTYSHETYVKDFTVINR